MDQKHDYRFSRMLRHSAVVALALAATACASTPPVPEAALQAARQSIATAEGVDAGHSAPGELGEARTKLSDANAAVKVGRMASAERLALQSRASADLAAAKTAAVKALAVNAEMKSSNVALVEELNRNEGESR